MLSHQQKIVEMKLKSNVDISDTNPYGFVVWAKNLPYNGGPGYGGVIYTIAGIKRPKNLIYKSILEANQDSLKLSKNSHIEFVVYIYKEPKRGS